MKKKNRNLEPEKKMENLDGKIDVADLPKYLPHSGIRPVDYTVEEGFANLEKEFENFCVAYITAAHPDMDNGNFLDAFIGMMENRAYRYIHKQREDHIQLINAVFRQMRTGDAVLIRSKLEDHKRQREEFKEELEELDRIYFKGTSLDRQRKNV